MDRLSLLLRTQDPAELRKHGIAADEHGRLVSIYEARALASRAIGNSWKPTWLPLPANLEASPRPHRIARGTLAAPVGDPDLD